MTQRPDYYIKRGFEPQRFFSCETKNQLLKTFEAIFKAERELECIRVQIKQRFCTKQAFEQID